MARPKQKKEIEDIKKTAKDEIAEVKDRLDPLKAEQAELEEMILNGYRSEQAQQELFDGDDDDISGTE
jgi:predicted nuclease with TOPRIM domain